MAAPSPEADASNTPARSRTPKNVGAKEGATMRNVALDLGARSLSYCEVQQGRVIDRATVRSLSALLGRLGPDQPPARVAFEACREGWHVHDTLTHWGNEPLMLDTTRIKQLGVGQHGRIPYSRTMLNSDWDFVFQSISRRSSRGNLFCN